MNLLPSQAFRQSHSNPNPNVIPFFQCVVFLLSFFIFLFSSQGTAAAIVAEETISFSPAASWNIYTSRHTVYDILISDDGAVLWAGTSGGIEKRNAKTGVLLETLTTISGLPKNEIWAFETDGSGGLWIGTGTTFNVEKSGLVHMTADGMFMLYNTENSGLPDNNIQTIRSDGAGGIWIGTCAGLVHYHEASNAWTVFDTSNSDIPGENVRAVAVDNNGDLWVAVSGSGLAYYSSDAGWKTIDMTDDSLSEEDIPVLLSDGTGGVWLGTKSRGLLHYKNDGTWEIFNTGNSGIVNNYAYSLALDGTGGIWVGSGTDENIDASGVDEALNTAGTGGGLSHYGVDGTWTVYNKADANIPENIINDIIVHENAGVWISTGAGLGRYTEAEGWQRMMETEPGLTGNSLFVLADDGMDGVWSAAGDMYSLAGDPKLARQRADGSWQVLDMTTSESGLSGEAVTSVNAAVSDGTGGTWIGTEKGLFHYTSDEKWEHFSFENGESGGNIAGCLSMDNGGGVWAAVWADNFFAPLGISHRAPDGTWQHFTADNSGLPHNAVKAFYPDDAGGMWVGTDGGLAHYSPDAGWDELFTMDNTLLQENTIYSLSGDGTGGLWIGTLESGVYHYSGEAVWTNYNGEDDPLQSTTVNALCQGGRGDVWMGTGDLTSFGMDMKGGLDYYSPDHGWMNFNTANSGLSSYLVSSLVSDGSGGVYVGTTFGGMAHLSPIGFPEQMESDGNTPDITLSWFLNRSPLENFDVKYVELQRALSRNGQYETVRDASNAPLRFSVDYSGCTNPRGTNCWPSIDHHTPETLGNGPTLLRGYRLDTPVTDPAWLEGVPRYYRLSVVMERDGKLLRAANNQAAVFMKPAVTENPRVEITPERSAIALAPGEETQISLFVSSMDLFAGDVEVTVESGTIAMGPAGSGSDLEYELSESNISLSPGDTSSLLLTLRASEGITASVHSDITITPVHPSSSNAINAISPSKGAVLTVKAGTLVDPVIAFGLVSRKLYPRVADTLTVAGNIVPATPGETVRISGADDTGAYDNASVTVPDVSVVTDEEGVFEGTVSLQASGTLTIHAIAGGLVSESVQATVLPAKSALSITSDATATTSAGDTLLINGIMTPIRPGSTEVGLDITWSGDGAGDSPNARVPQFSGDVPVDEGGRFSKSIRVPGKGFIHVRAQLADTPDYLAATSVMSVPVGQPVGEAIVMVSEAGSAAFREISSSLGSRVYTTMRNRNIPAERIYYMGASEAGIESQGSAAREGLRSAIVEWTLSRISTDDPFDTPLNLYLIGRTEDDMFLLNDQEQMSVDELKQYLDDAEALLKESVPACEGFPVTIVLEGARTGAWIKEISGSGRMVLTSSSDREIGEGGYAGYACDGECSFTRYFYQYVNTGWDIDASFAEANFEILNYYRHIQRPAMDSDGDGRVTDFDRNFAVERYIEYRPSGNLRPVIKAVSVSATVNGVVKKGLSAVAEDPENRIQGVFCDITDPLGENFTVQLDQARSSLFTADFKGYYHKGTYEIVFYAKDSSGNTSLPEKRSVNVISPVTMENSPPDAPELFVTVEGTMVTIYWTPLVEASGYQLYFAPYPGAEYIGELEMGSETSISFDGEGYAFYMAVTALNGAGESGYSNISFFDLE